MPQFENEIHFERLSWFIRLRWGAVAGGAAILLAGPLIIPLDIKYGRLFPCVVALGVLNAVYLLYWGQVKSSVLPAEKLAAKARGLFRLQMILDLFLLTLMLLFSGGAENPLILFYLFHLAISAMIFPVGESLFYATLALGLPWLLYFTEHLGSYSESLWEGMAGLSRVHERSILWAYSIAVGGLWFFLSRLAMDLRAKERDLRVTGDKLLVANEELKQMDLFKDRFLRQVVFQLKSPTIEMDFDLSAAEKAVTPKGGKALEAIQMAKKRVWSLLELIEDLVWLSRLEVQDIPFHKEWIEVYEALLKRVQVLEDQARQKGIEFKLHGDPQVRLRADKEAFDRVADNLLSNAIKYTPEGKSQVVVEFQVSENWLVMTVQDEGIGIPPKQQKKIFDEFFRGSNAKTLDKFGTGLGLSIVKRVMDWHGGKVVLSGETKQGTKVKTWWPLDESIKPPPAKG